MKDRSEIDWCFVNRNSMFLFCITQVWFDSFGDPCMGKVLFAIRQFWIWNLLYGRKS